MSTTAKDLHFVLSRLSELGIGYDDAQKLRRISMTLRRWFELECGTDAGHIERDEKTDVPRFFNARARFLDPHDPRAYHAIPDREKGARKRLAAIMARYPDLHAYIQTDPRGCAVHILQKPQLAVGISLEQWAEQQYTSGIAVF